jgi:Bacterial aa3 type cytochrome c oxidase subunit IV
MQTQRALGDFEKSGSENVYSTSEGMDYPAHEQQYKSFIKIGTIAAGTVATIVILMAIFLT